jgi:hypothetical protein
MDNLPSRSSGDGAIEDNTARAFNQSPSTRNGDVGDNHRTYSLSRSNTVNTNAPPPSIPPSHHNPPLLPRSHLSQQPNTEIRRNEALSRGSTLFEQLNLRETQRYIPATPRNHDISSNTERVSHSRAINNSGYYVRDGLSGEQFYVQGKVFSVVWSEPLGEGARRNSVESRSSNYSRSSGSSVVNVYTNTALFIVLKVETKFCICLRMNTYHYQGLRSRKLTDSDRRAHAVVYSSTLPRDTEDDECTQQPAIAVRPSRLDRTLHKKSRLNLAKPYSVERNLRVKDRGEVINFELLKSIAQPYLSL